MPTLKEFLSMDAEPMPAWLERHDPGDVFPEMDFFSSRVTFYPGSGSDGHAVEVFGGAGACHAFVYVDYLHSKAAISRDLGGRGGHSYDAPFRAYRTMDAIDLELADLSPRGWRAHVHPGEGSPPSPGFEPYGFLAVLERKAGLDDSHGPRRLAVLFLGADGVAAYDALFCQDDGVAPPYAVLLQDHGFGGNYTRFGESGLLKKVAVRSATFPRHLLVAENTRPWHSWMKVEGVEGGVGGMHRDVRFLHFRASRDGADARSTGVNG